MITPNFTNNMESVPQNQSEVLPSLIKDHGDACFDLSTNSAFGIAGENEDVDQSSVSISIPSSPELVIDEASNSQTKQGGFHSQQMEKPCCNETIVSSTGKSANSRLVQLSDNNKFPLSNTFSEESERQISNDEQVVPPDQGLLQSSEAADSSLPVDRNFDDLEGPELDTSRASEEKTILPPDDKKKWPFLLRFPISSFGICLGISSQAIMWKSLSSSELKKFLHIAPKTNLVLWLASLVLVLIVALTYTLKIIFYFEAVRREYYHPIRVNFFFAPWIALLFLALGVPCSITETLHGSLWYVLMAPIFCLDLKIYGQWMSGGQTRLSRVANPLNHLSVTGNLAGALLGASMGLKEGPAFFFAVGLAHYVVLFVTLYQRLPTNETLPKELHPIFFLFIAAPSMASMAWARIQGSFDIGSRIAYFIALFLYFSLAVRVNFFRGFRFSLAWWAYTLPTTGAATATVTYSNVVKNNVTIILTATLCFVATLTVSALLVTTVVHAFVLRDLFPNDMAISIRKIKPQKSRNLYHIRTETPNSSFEHYSKYSNKDIESGDYHQPTTTS